MDTDYKNKLLQISYKDSTRKKADESDDPESRRASIRRLLQKMQEGPVPDMNTDKEVTDEKDNAILRQIEGLEDEEAVPAVKPRKKGLPS